MTNNDLLLLFFSYVFSHCQLISTFIILVVVVVECGAAQVCAMISITTCDDDSTELEEHTHRGCYFRRRHTHRIRLRHDVKIVSKRRVVGNASR
uniref:Putative secreted protein n=1 Tax=Anopheles darlingi TaxID=43151 RepID=A0A2M4DJX8_ANODA